MTEGVALTVTERILKILKMLLKVSKKNTESHSKILKMTFRILKVFLPGAQVCYNYILLGCMPLHHVCYVLTMYYCFLHSMFWLLLASYTSFSFSHLRHFPLLPPSASPPQALLGLLFMFAKSLSLLF